MSSNFDEGDHKLVRKNARQKPAAAVCRRRKDPYPTSDNSRSDLLLNYYCGAGLHNAGLSDFVGSTITNANAGRHILQCPEFDVTGLLAALLTKHGAHRMPEGRSQAPWLGTATKQRSHSLQSL